MVEVTQEVRDAAAEVLDAVSNLLEHDGIGQVADLIRDGEYDEHECLQIIAAHRTATLQRVIDLANACVEQGLPLTAMVPMLEDMR